MGWQTLGDSAWLFALGEGSPGERLQASIRLARRLERAALPGVTDVVNGYDTVAVYCDPSWLEEVGIRVCALTDEREAPGDEVPELVEVPVCYGGSGGPDLETVAATLGMSPDEVVRRHAQTEFTVATIGFSPGFPYLAGLPEELALPRRATPRSVAAGSVAIAGKQSGVYPVDSPAGWHVIGRTALRLFDPHSERPGRVKPGDRVRFVPVESLQEPKAAPSRAGREGDVEILDPGALTTVQDAGRSGFRKWGVTSGGGVDPVAMAVANELVGNQPDAPVLEVCLSGPRLRFHRATRVAWVGWRHGGTPVEMAAWEELDLRRDMGSVRGIIAVAGGFVTPRVMGSSATDLRGGFGGVAGRALEAGDRLITGEPGRVRRAGAWRVGWPAPVMPDGWIELRFVRGVQAPLFSDEAWSALEKSGFMVSPASNRMGVRLEGIRVAPPEGFEMVSQPVVPGSIQVPPDGVPVVLMNECQTLGGYPQIGHVISADLPLLGRAWPGTRVRFREVTTEEAVAAWQELAMELGRLRVGLDLLG